MSHWSDIRAQARRRHLEVRRFAGQAAPHLAGAELSTAQLLSYAETMTGIVRVPLASGDPLLYGAQATLDDGFIYYNAETEPWLALYYQAHEFAHHWLHKDNSSCAKADVDFAASEDKSLYGVNRIEAYGPQQRRETEANVFAREFLLPANVLRQWFIGENLNAAQIAARAGVGLDFTLHALAHALLAPDIERSHEPDVENISTNDVSPTTKDAAITIDEQTLTTNQQTQLPFTLDDSQRAAAHSRHTPLLVAAGPGTGKTRALVGRILHLLNENVAPGEILALTFSNKAAEEMRERVGRFAPDAQNNANIASKIWMGTFHAFGLEILRRYWQAAGLAPRPRVLDPVDALFILERHLPQLRLDHYQNLHEPATHLSHILAAISRAKDELVSPDKYHRLASEMLERAQAASDEEAIRKAERAVEVARVYEFYQNHLEREGLLDFGDLIFRTVRLLREKEGARKEIQAEYRHVLVDEYQDVNRACGVLLGLVKERGEGLWVVGDTRQAIYRWRGAAPAQVRHFLKDFPHGRIQSLTINYRSLPPILKLVSALAAQMSVSAQMKNSDDDAVTVTSRADFAAWHAHRQEAVCDAQDTNHATNEKSAVRFEIATDAEAEARELARLIKQRARGGVPFRHQAIICRKHSQLVKFARGLEAEGVPALYLGDIFERSEVRDLLALLALVSGKSGRTLPRVARFPEYDIPLGEVRRMLQAAKDAGGEVFELDAPVENPSTGATGAGRLAFHLKRVAHVSSAWKLLAHYLFVHSRYLQPLLADESVAGVQRRLAIRQLLQFLHNEEERAIEATNDVDARRAILRYVRRLKSFSEDKNLRQVPASAEDLDAVRLTTVHGAKGLEWSCVYLPHLGKGHFPNRRKHEHCPPPVGMIETFMSDAAHGTKEKDDEPDAHIDAHLEEEECLFFVAVSRARDQLCLSRAERYGGASSKASEFLERIEIRLPRSANSAATWRVETPDAAVPIQSNAVPQPSVSKPRFTERQLNTYLKCPRKYFYEQRLYLSGKSEEAAYLRFHICVYEVLGWLTTECIAGRLSEASADVFQQQGQARLTELWREKGLAGHVYETIYREQAALMVERAVRHFSRARGQLFHQTWTIERPHAFISVAPDYMELIEETTGATLLFRHTRTGKPPAKPTDDDLYALYHAIAAEHFLHAQTRIEILYLSTDEIIELNLKERTIMTRLKHYDDAISGIIREEFPPDPSAHLCPQCAHFFTCPKAEE